VRSGSILELEMKRTLAASLVVLSFGLAHMGAARTQNVTPKPLWFSLTISSGSQTVKSGSKILIDVAYKNTSDRQIPAPLDIQILNLKVIISGAGGRSVPQTDRGKEWNLGGWVSSGPGFPMEPGATVHRQIVVSDLYDMTVPGKYLIRLERNDLASNTITVKVVP
jgi:hypothetical protein